MTTRTNYPVRCQCGLEGAIRLAENDAPFSLPDERYTPIGLSGGRACFDRAVSWEEVFAEMGLRCSRCNTVLTPANLV